MAVTQARIVTIMNKNYKVRKRPDVTDFISISQAETQRNLVPHSVHCEKYNNQQAV